MPTRMLRATNAKQTHKLRPQTCVLWIPDASGYAANFGPSGLTVSNSPDQAYHLTEDEAEDLALRMRAQLGTRASIRPYYVQSPSYAGRA